MSIAPNPLHISPPNLDLSHVGHVLDRPRTGLPGDALLTVFEFYLSQSCGDCPPGERRTQSKWRPLAHVSRQWRYTLFGSIRTLRLGIKWDGLCYRKITAEELSHWYPGFPLHITFDYHEPDTTRVTITDADMDLFRSAIQHLDRAYNIRVEGFSSYLSQLIPHMVRPAPELESLTLWSDEHWCPEQPPSIITFPDGFLGGSTPRLRHLTLREVPPSFPLSLLQSESVRFVPLRTLDLELPETGYISPDSLLAYLPMIPQLEELRVVFPKEAYGRGSHEPLTGRSHIVLPHLKTIDICCASAWIEAFLAAIEAPALDHLSIRFTDDDGVSSPELANFISRTFASPFTSVNLVFRGIDSQILIYGPSLARESWCVYLNIGYPAYDVQLASVSDIFTSLASTLSSVTSLQMDGWGSDYFNGIRRYDDYGSIPPEWYQEDERDLFYSMLEPFSGVDTLYINPGLADPVGCLISGEPLEEDVLPRLVNLRVELDGKKFKYKEDEISGFFQKFVNEREQMGQEVQLDVSSICYYAN